MYVWLKQSSLRCSHVGARQTHDLNAMSGTSLPASHPKKADRRFPSTLTHHVYLELASVRSTSFVALKVPSTVNGLAYQGNQSFASGVGVI
jgi:hypothetical protein